MNFSFFEIDSLTAMKEAVREVFIQDFQKGKANFIKTPFIISEFIDPSYGMMMYFVVGKFHIILIRYSSFQIQVMEE